MTQLSGKVTVEHNLSGIVQTRPSGSAADLNIAYGPTAPEDTGKLWIKSDIPSRVLITEESIAAGTPHMDGNADTYSPAYPKSAYAAVGDKMYQIGGYISYSTYYKYIRCYDTKTGALTSVYSTLDTGKEVSAVAVGSKLYIIAPNWIRIFDTATNKSTYKSASIGSRQTCAAVVDKKIYIFGGMYSTTGSADTYLKTIRCYDTEKDVFTEYSTDVQIPYALANGCAVAVGSKIYLFGGCSGFSSELKYIYCFDTDALTVTKTAAVLPTALCHIGGAALGGRIYLFGGATDENGWGQSPTSYSVKTVYEFDPATESITLLPVTLPTKAASVGACVVGENIYIMDPNGGISIFSVQTPMTTGEMRIVVGNGPTLCPLVRTDAVNIHGSITGVYMGDSEGYASQKAAYLHDGEAWNEI